MEAATNIEAEQVVLGTLLIDPQANHFAKILEVADFAGEPHQAIFAAIRDAAQEGCYASPIVLAPRFQGQTAAPGVTLAEYSARLLTMAAERRVMPDYIRALKEMSGKRTLATLARVMTETAASPSAALGPVVQDAIASLDEVLSGLRRQRETSFMAGELAHRILDRLRSGQKPNLIDTGLYGLNNLMGGFGRGNLVILAGRTSMGKTTVAVSAMRQAAIRGVSALMLSQEMPGENVMHRMMADMASGPPDPEGEHWRQGPIEYERMIANRVTPDEIRRLEKAACRIDLLPIRIDEQTSLTVSDIGVRARRYAEQLAAEGKTLDVLWIDHLGFIQASMKQIARRHELDEITKALRALAKELNICIVLLCQLNRNSESREDKRPQLFDLRESGTIEEDADVVLFTFREYYWLKRMGEQKDQEEERERLAKMEMTEKIIEVICAKRRDGSIFNKNFYANMGSNTIADMAA